MTLKKINEALKAAGADCELVKAKRYGYFFFMGNDADRFKEQGV